MFGYDVNVVCDTLILSRKSFEKIDSHNVTLNMELGETDSIA